MRIHQADGKNKNGPTRLEYRDVQKRTAYMFGGVGSPLRKLKNWARRPARSAVMNIASAW